MGKETCKEVVEKVYSLWIKLLIMISRKPQPLQSTEDYSDDGLENGVHLRF